MSHVMVKTSIIKFIFVNIVCISCLLKFPNSFFVFSKWSAGTISNTARKTIFSFSTRPEKMVFPKKIALEYDLSRIIGKDHVFLSRKYDPAILCTFKETFTGVFIYCSPAKKNQET